VKKINKRNVYCLASKKNGNFIANGIVVKNCDALRYAMYSHLFGKEGTKSMTPQDIERNYAEAMGDNSLPAPFRDMPTGGYGSRY